MQSNVQSSIRRAKSVWEFAFCIGLCLESILEAEMLSGNKALGLGWDPWKKGLYHRQFDHLSSGLVYMCKQSTLDLEWTKTPDNGFLLYWELSPQVWCSGITQRLQEVCLIVWRLATGYMHQDLHGAPSRLCLESLALKGTVPNTTARPQTSATTQSTVDTAVRKGNQS